MISAVVVAVSCDSKKTLGEEVMANLCKHEYYGYWAETFWTYQFHKDGTFTFLCDGHYSTDCNDTGIYTVLDSFILLVPNTDWRVYAGVLKNKLKYIDKNRIRDYDGYYYTSNFDSIHYYNQLRYDFVDSTKSVLNGLDEVIKAKARIGVKGDSWYDKHNKPEFWYDGIIVVDNVELHSFNLITYDYDCDYPHKNSHLSLLIKKIPFEVYQYNYAGSKLTLIYKK